MEEWLEKPPKRSVQKTSPDLGGLAGAESSSPELFMSILWRLSLSSFRLFFLSLTILFFFFLQEVTRGSFSGEDTCLAFGDTDGGVVGVGGTVVTAGAAWTTMGGGSELSRSATSSPPPPPPGNTSIWAVFGCSTPQPYHWHLVTFFPGNCITRSLFLADTTRLMTRNCTFMQDDPSTLAPPKNS